MLGQYLPLLALFVLAALFAAVSFVVSGLFAPRNPSAAKQAPYECGIVPTRETPERFPVRFFLVAMIFIVFDIEIIFFYPWAIAQEPRRVRARADPRLLVRGLRVVRVPDRERRPRVGSAQADGGSHRHGVGRAHHHLHRSPCRSGGSRPRRRADR
ncbi:MAG: NADH-quinone oxidoreductase subunit A [Acidimicrobiales bacterium]